jgi:hypothetical protein
MLQHRHLGHRLVSCRCDCALNEPTPQLLTRCTDASPSLLPPPPPAPHPPTYPILPIASCHLTARAHSLRPQIPTDAELDVVTSGRSFLQLPSIIEDVCHEHAVLDHDDGQSEPNSDGFWTPRSSPRSSPRASPRPSPMPSSSSSSPRPSPIKWGGRAATGAPSSSLSPAPNRWSTPVSPRGDGRERAESCEKPPTPPPRLSLAHLQLPTSQELGGSRDGGLEPDNDATELFDEDAHQRVSVWTPPPACSDEHLVIGSDGSVAPARTARFQSDDVSKKSVAAAARQVRRRRSSG